MDVAQKNNKEVQKLCCKLLKGLGAIHSIFNTCSVKPNVVPRQIAEQEIREQWKLTGEEFEILAQLMRGIQTDSGEGVEYTELLRLLREGKERGFAAARPRPPSYMAILSSPRSAKRELSGYFNSRSDHEGKMSEADYVRAVRSFFPTYEATKLYQQVSNNDKAPTKELVAVTLPRLPLERQRTNNSQEAMATLQWNDTPQKVTQTKPEKKSLTPRCTRTTLLRQECVHAHNASIQQVAPSHRIVRTPREITVAVQQARAVPH